MKILNRIKGWLFLRRHLSNDVSAIRPTETVVVDSQVDRLKRSMLAQKKQVWARAMKAHDGDCPDVFNCSKDICYKGGGDKFADK